MNATDQVSRVRRARVNRSAAQWRTVIDEQQQSGLTQEAFCKAHGVSSTALAKWRQRLGAGGRRAAIGNTKAASASSSPAFVEIAPPPRVAQGAMKVRLDLGAGIVLELTRA